MLHWRNNDYFIFRKDKYSRLTCCIFKIYSEIKMLLKPQCQQAICITNKTCDTQIKWTSLDGLESCHHIL
jgi:hypothetical protein